MLLGDGQFGCGFCVSCTGQAREFAAKVGELKILDDCGHQLYLENPPAFNAAVLEFCHRDKPLLAQQLVRDMKQAL
jgi:pimeloyl-ACP methyl ester carboxylesterase